MTYRTQIEDLLTARRPSEIRNAERAGTALDESTYPELDSAVRKTMDGFIQVLTAAKAVRDAQKMYFRTRASGDLEKSKQAERILDKLITFWQAEMAPPPAQTNLFD